MRDPTGIDDLVFPRIDRGDLEPYTSLFDEFPCPFYLCLMGEFGQIGRGV
jgi:hypothetical protein